MRSALDTHDYKEYDSRSQSVLQSPEKPRMNIQAKQSRATKLRDLSSNVLGNNDDIQKHFEADNSKNVIVDWDLKDLPSTTDAEKLKKIANVKHVITATVDSDAITNSCTGTGRVKFRLGPNEDAETVKVRYLKEGFGLVEH
mmetsp:Transcript_5178/g.3870  ORF Transcript_5178/g.3870 Transcript_5178/m.3870 type:complete len:142 (+) Transcript_5178:197-622(+)